MRPAQNLLTEQYLKHQLGELEARTQGRILIQRNLQHEALNKVLEELHQQREEALRVGAALTQIAAAHEARLLLLERPWWQRLAAWARGVLHMSQKQPYEMPQLLPCPICGAKDKLSHAKDCPHWDSGNVTVTPEAAALRGEGQ